MLTLRPMTDDEYGLYSGLLLEGYARERAENSGLPLEEERMTAAAQTQSLLPQGARTPAHYLWNVVDDTDGVVGNLWVFVDESKRRAFIYDIEMAEAHRGKGYGERTLALLDDHMRALGIQRIALNVFASNTVARHLYDKVGYYPVATTMQKDL